MRDVSAILVLTTTFLPKPGIERERVKDREIQRERDTARERDREWVRERERQGMSESQRVSE